MVERVRWGCISEAEGRSLASLTKAMGFSSSTHTVSQIIKVVSEDASEV